MMKERESARVVASISRKDTPVAYRLLLLFVASVLPSALSAEETDSAPEISADQIKAHVAYLASDRLVLARFALDVARDIANADRLPTGNPGDEFRPARDKLVLRQAQDADEERKAIKTLLNDQVTAWNKGDLLGFMKGYWESDQLTFFSGSTRTSGWKATLERYRKKYQGEGKEMGRLSFEELSIDFLGPEHALVRGRFRLQMKDAKSTGLFTLILRRTRAGWRIIHDHTSS
jgi:ketosteroid isomerase-like protein